MAGSVFYRCYFFLLFCAGLRVLDHRDAVRPAQLVIEPPQNKSGVFDILKFSIAIEVGAVKLYVCMDMGLVHMGRHYKLVLASSKLHRQLIAEPVGILRADFPWLERLDNAVHDNIMFRRLFPPGDLVVELFTDLKFFCGGFR